LASSPHIIIVIISRRMGWTERVARMGAKRIAYGVLVRKYEGKRTLGRQMRGKCK
jgi:hypothetical protein